MKTSLMERLLSKVVAIPECGCWIFEGCSHKTGYGRIGMPNGGIEYSHRAAWIAFHGQIPDGMLVCHSCDVRYCVNPSHLFLGTHSDNMKDASRKGRIVLPSAESMLRGQDQPMSKLTEVDVYQIRLSNGTQKEIAERFSISRSAVSLIRNRKTWRHV